MTDTFQRHIYGETRSYIERNEGRKRKLYYDCEGNATVGVGCNITANGFPLSFSKDDIVNGIRWGFNKTHIDIMLTDHIEIAIKDVNRIFGIKDFLDFSFSRQKALIDMDFNMGYTRLSGFKKMIEAIRHDDWEEASNQVVDSVYCREHDRIEAKLRKEKKKGVFNRARENAEMLKNGLNSIKS